MNNQELFNWALETLDNGFVHLATARHEYVCWIKARDRSYIRSKRSTCYREQVKAEVEALDE